ncbi:MAG: hypothetical protein K8T91_14985 [Planctomycetes bacterium]|nr:hypothetical protein [Planctomycetota bacterium]
MTRTLRFTFLQTCIQPCLVALVCFAMCGCHPFSGSHPSGIFTASDSRDDEIRKKAEKDPFPAEGQSFSEAAPVQSATSASSRPAVRVR